MFLIGYIRCGLEDRRRRKKNSAYKGRRPIILHHRASAILLVEDVYQAGYDDGNEFFSSFCPIFKYIYYSSRCYTCV